MLIENLLGFGPGGGVDAVDRVDAADLVVPREPDSASDITRFPSDSRAHSPNSLTEWDNMGVNAASPIGTGIATDPEVDTQ